VFRENFDFCYAKSDHIEIGTNGPRIFADATDYHGFSATIRRIHDNSWLILVSQNFSLTPNLVVAEILRLETNSGLSCAD
jgi:hypothetical protein